MRTKHRWFIGCTPPRPSDDDLRVGCSGLTTIFDATSWTDAMKQYRETVRRGGIPKRSIIYGVGMVDADGVMHKYMVSNGKLVEA
jgi:hypothetical protein